MIVALVMLLQAGLPTVGDTIWLSRSVQAPPGAEVRAAPWPAAADVALLGEPVIRREGPATIVAYPVTIWTAGSHVVSVPGPIVIQRNGLTDSLPDEARTVVVASVLPDSLPRDSLPVQPEAGIVPQRITSPWPVLVALLAGAIIFLPAAWWWRRPGPPMPPQPVPPAPAPVDLAAWAEAGELRAVAAVATRSLRAAILGQLPGIPQGLVTSRLIRVMTEQRPSWPVEEIGTVLRGLEAVQYSEAPAADVLALADRAGVLTGEVRRRQSRPAERVRT